MEPLHCSQTHKLSTLINRSHLLFHFTAVCFMTLYRLSSFRQTKDTTPLLPWLLLSFSEILLSYICFIGLLCRLRPISRTAFPERLHDHHPEHNLPSIDVFICTADPEKEPVLDVMNTVLSAMALDYPPQKLNVYLSDDGCSSITLLGMRAAYEFAKWWIPFCRRFDIKSICPHTYFSCPEEDDFGHYHPDFSDQKRKLQAKYDILKEDIQQAIKRGGEEDRRIRNIGNHQSIVEIIEETGENATGVPRLVYVSREKKPSHPHHYKAGALNVLLRVSSVMSNSPYILVLDCDMNCNDPSSAKQAMCFHLDPHLSRSLAFVQFPQTFRNISTSDIYDSAIRSIFQILWFGLDGLRGPILSGTNFYMKRKSLYSNLIRKDKKEYQLEAELESKFGSSKVFLNSLREDYTPAIDSKHYSSSKILQEAKLVASCAYETNSKWGDEVGFRYHSLVEDYFTGFMLHCQGWKSVYVCPTRPQFLGTSTTDLNLTLVQNSRWAVGLFQVCFSKFSPLFYGSLRMSILQSMAFAHIASYTLYSPPLLCYATIPQLCLLNGIPLFPQAKSSYFNIFVFVFLSGILKHLQEVVMSGGSVNTWINEQRIWMMKSVTSYMYAALNGCMEKIGLVESSFLPTNKVDDSEQVNLYKMGVFDFRASKMLVVPLVSIIILNLVAFGGGVYRMVFAAEWENFILQVLLSLYILIVNYPVIEGMILRKDKGRIPPSVTLLSAIVSAVFFSFGSIILRM